MAITDRRFNDVIRLIKSSKMTNGYKSLLVDYINDVKEKKRNNDFIDDDFLERVMIQLVNDYEESQKYVEEGKTPSIINFEEILKSTLYIFPFGNKTEDYDKLKEFFIKNIRHHDKMFNDKLYGIFTYKRNYIDIVNIIYNDNKLSESFDKIVEFAVKVNNYCGSDEERKGAILAFIYDIPKCDDIDTLISDRVYEAKKKLGIYDLSEKTLSLLDEKCRIAVNLFDKYEEFVPKLNSFREEINEILRISKADLERDADGALNKVNDAIDKRIDKLLVKLDDTRLDIEQQMMKKTDETFNKLLVDAAEKLNDLEVAVRRITTTSDAEIIRIEKTTQESFDRLRKHVEEDPQLKEIVKQASENVASKQGVANVKITKAVQQVVDEAEEGYIIANNVRRILPADSSVDLSKAVDPTILPAFDNTIDFDVRMAKITDEINRRKADGEIFHTLIDEIIRCVMEGDWVYLWGPSGCGKTYVIRQVAELLGIELVENGKIVNKYDIMGFNDPQGRFRATQAFKAVLHGDLIAFDEFDNDDTSSQICLNGFYSGSQDIIEDPTKERFITFGEDVKIPIHTNFRMIAAGNTSGNGANEQYLRGRIDESVQERLTPIRFYYDNQVEEQILSEWNDSWYKLFTCFRDVCDGWADKKKKEHAQGIITTRDASAIARYIRHNSKTIDQVMREKFTQVKDVNYLTHIKDRTHEMFPSVPQTDLGIIKRLGEYSKEELAQKLMYTCSNEIEKIKARNGISKL